MADNALIQSGQRMFDQLATIPDAAGAFNEGVELITDQIDKNLKLDREAEDRDYLMKKRADEEFLREMDIEKKVTQYQEEKGAYFSLIEEGLESGRLEPVDYAGFAANRETWWKDKANRLKFFEDSPELKKSLENAEAAEGNWSNILGFTEGVSISDSSPDAQIKDLAISMWSKKEGATPPPIETIDGKDYFVLPTADGSDTVKLPVEQAAKAKQPGDLYGQYDEKVTFEGFQKGLITKLPGVEQKFRLGEATQQDIKKVEQWFDKQVANNEQLIELADSFIQELGDEADWESMGISDKNNDGKITGADLDRNNDGTIDETELRGMRNLFKEVMTGFYGKQQQFQKNKEGEFTQAQVSTGKAFERLKLSGGDLNELLRIRNNKGAQVIHDIKIEPENGRAILFIGNKFKEENAFIVDIDPATGRVTPSGYRKLQSKFDWVNLNQGNRDTGKKKDKEDVKNTEVTDVKVSRP